MYNLTSYFHLSKFANPSATPMFMPLTMDVIHSQWCSYQLIECISLIEANAFYKLVN